MKIAYLSQTALSDVDISYIKAAQKMMDITYYILVGPSQRQKAAMNFETLPDHFEIIHATKVKELAKFGRVLNLDKVYIVSYSGNHRHIERLYGSYKVYRELANKGYDVIHLTWPPDYLDRFIFFLKKKIILTVHDPFPHSSVVSTIREYERKRAFKKINHFILLNKTQQEGFINYYNNIIDKSKHIYSSYLSCYDYLHIYDDQIEKVSYNQIIFFGQIFSHKGVDYLLNAMEIVHDQMPEVKLIVAGSGKFWFDILKYKDCSYVDIINKYIPDNMLVKLISSSALVIVPYIDATQSGVIMTAYAFNKPCIATNVGALPEMVKDGENGVVVPPKDINALSNAIIQLLKDPHLIDVYSNRIKELYSEGEKSWNYIAEKHLDIYNSINN